MQGYISPRRCLCSATRSTSGAMGGRGGVVMSMWLRVAMDNSEGMWVSDPLKFLSELPVPPGGCPQPWLIIFSLPGSSQPDLRVSVSDTWLEKRGKGFSYSHILGQAVKRGIFPQFSSLPVCHLLPKWKNNLNIQGLQAARCNNLLDLLLVPGLVNFMTRLLSSPPPQKTPLPFWATLTWSWLHCVLLHQRRKRVKTQVQTTERVWSSGDG